MMTAPPLPTVTYTQNLAFAWLLLGGSFCGSLLKAWLDRHHASSSIFYSAVAAIILLVFAFIRIVPGRLVLSAQGVRMTLAGMQVFDFPWNTIASIEARTISMAPSGLFQIFARAPINHLVAISVKPEHRKKPLMTPPYDYDRGIPASWFGNLDLINDQLLTYWRAHGGEDAPATP